MRKVYFDFKCTNKEVLKYMNKGRRYLAVLKLSSKPKTKWKLGSTSLDDITKRKNSLPFY